MSMTDPSTIARSGKWCLPVISAAVMLLAAAAFDSEAELGAAPCSARRSPGQAGREPQEIRPALYSGSSKSRCEILTVGSTSFPASLAPVSRRAESLSQLAQSAPREQAGRAERLEPANRMAAVKKLVRDYPLSKPATSRFLRRVDLGEYSPFELASLFMIWQGLSESSGVRSSGCRQSRSGTMR